VTRFDNSVTQIRKAVKEEKIERGGRRQTNGGKRRKRRKRRSRKRGRMEEQEEDSFRHVSLVCPVMFTFESFFIGKTCDDGTT